MVAIWNGMVQKDHCIAGMQMSKDGGSPKAASGLERTTNCRVQAGTRAKTRAALRAFRPRQHMPDQPNLKPAFGVWMVHHVRKEPRLSSRVPDGNSMAFVLGVLARLDWRGTAGVLIVCYVCKFVCRL